MWAGGDLTSDESPVVISSFTSKIELGCIGRAAPVYCVLCFTDRGMCLHSVLKTLVSEFYCVFYSLFSSRWRWQL